MRVLKEEAVEGVKEDLPEVHVLLEHDVQRRLHLLVLHSTQHGPSATARGTPPNAELHRIATV